jgi:hypothetical protein
MLKWLGIIFGTLRSAFTQRDLAIENLALRQQVAVLKEIIGTRTHLSLYRDALNRRPVQPLEQGRVIELKGVGGLHHQYVRLVA